MNSYSETLTYLFSLHRLGMKFGLEPITHVLGRLQDPQRQYATFHIGGTNGKGSSAAMLARILEAGGHRVGLYTSPHLHDFCERIRVNGACITEGDVCALTDRIRRVLPTKEALTFFELTTAMAFLYFYDRQVDVAVIEVGMGGRYDATNVLNPLAVLLTGVGLDHEEFLGRTPSDIAREKVEIFRPNTPIVVGPVDAEVRAIVKAKAQSVQSSLWGFGEDFLLTTTASGTFTYQGPHWRLPDVPINLPGTHQMVNAANVIALLETTQESRLSISRESIYEGLSSVTWKGRLEILQQNPLIVLDGAHNPAAASVLCNFLRSQIHDVPDRKLLMIWGMMDDKDHRSFLAVLSPLIDAVIITQPHMNRAASVDVLKEVVQNAGLPVSVVPEPVEALELAKKRARSSDLICITGSLFLVGEVSGHFIPSSSTTVQA